MAEYTNRQTSRHILYCKCGGERIQPELKHAIEAYLKDLPVNVTQLSDLCGLVAIRKDLLSDLLSPDTEYLVIGCHRRTMDLLFNHIREVPVNPARVEHINLLLVSPELAIAQISAFCNGSVGSAVHREIVEDSGWPSWYPVIDYTRCTACGQCADFCLFGVYEKADSRIDVIHPQGCKNNCPACARICPSTAIIFPKYKNGGAIGGSDEIDERIEQQRQAQDIESILGDDLYEALEKRRAKRKSIIREEAMYRALSERDNALHDVSKN